MNNIAEILYQFWSSFGVPAFVEGYVPDDNTAELYITYSLVQPEWMAQTTHYARVWQRSTSYAQITQLIDSISSRIGLGISLPAESGSIYLFKDSQFIQFQQSDDLDWKIAYLSMIIEANIAKGASL